MRLADARALCPDLVTRTASPHRDTAFLAALLAQAQETARVSSLGEQTGQELTDDEEAAWDASLASLLARLA